jgi:predicted nucleic acid-binding protein
MIVFSNTTPFIALSSINQLNLLPQLFGTIHVVYEVAEECRAGSFIAVPDLESLPWVSLVESQFDINYKTVLLELDKGEKHTLNMALKLKADKVIIDEKIGRNIAEYLGLSVVGTLGILIAAKQRGWINSFSNLVKDMRSQGIYYHPGLVKKLSQTIGE